jgi:hypothetical protein
MGARELKDLLDAVPDTHELVLRRAATAGPAWAAVHDAWNDANDEAELALAAWLRSGGTDAYAAYRAAQDREDAAQDALFRAVADDRVVAAAASARLAVIAR